MSEPTTDPTAAAPAPEPQGDPVAEPLGEGGIKALAAERDARKAAEKSAADLQTKLDEINRANESLIEKAQREANEAKENATTATVTAFREAAVKFGGISAEDAELFLTGTDAETLSKQAARLMDRTPTAAPRPDLSQGGKGTPATGSPEQDFANFLNGQLAG